jgi:hypothetical protein
MAMVMPLCRPSLYRRELAFKSFQADYKDSFQRPRTVIFASATEPKWKQKLAAADEHQERTRQATAQAQEEYRRKQDALRRQQSQGAGEIPSLKDLEYYSYLTEEGLIADCTRPDAKASVYAIFDQNKTLCYIGVSRQVSSENLELPTLPCISLTLWFHCPFLFKTLQEYSSICDIWDYLCCPWMYLSRVQNSWGESGCFENVEFFLHHPSSHSICWQIMRLMSCM